MTQTAASRRGSSMSEKQLAKAALKGRRLSFHFLTPNHIVHGYLVGMDDYHWMIATPLSEASGEPVSIKLVHKGSVDLISMTNHNALTTEIPAVQSSVEKIGRSFLAYCKENFTGAAPASA